MRSCPRRRRPRAAQQPPWPDRRLMRRSTRWSPAAAFAGRTPVGGSGHRGRHGGEPIDKAVDGDRADVRHGAAGEGRVAGQHKPRSSDTFTAATWSTRQATEEVAAGLRVGEHPRRAITGAGAACTRTRTVQRRARPARMTLRPRAGSTTPRCAPSITWSAPHADMTRAAVPATTTACASAAHRCTLGTWRAGGVTANSTWRNGPTTEDGGRPRGDRPGPRRRA